MIHTLLDLFTLIAILASVFLGRRMMLNLFAAIDYQQKMIDALATRLRRLEAGKATRSADPGED